MTYIDLIVDIASPGTFVPDLARSGELLAEWGDLGEGLRNLLLRRNGFYAFESALHVYGISPSDRRSASAVDLVEWNSQGAWRFAYGELAKGYLFFAEDVFGGQFAIAKDVGIVSFDPETAEARVVAGSFDRWCREVLRDSDYLTGYPLAHEWQTRFGALAAGSRLSPKIPFVAGGDYRAENLYAVDAVKGMRARGEIAVQIAGLPDGATIRFKVVE